jgi:hypothetical protein
MSMEKLKAIKSIEEDIRVLDQNFFVLKQDYMRKRSRLLELAVGIENMRTEPGLHTLADMPIEEKKAFMAEVMAEARELQEQKLEEAKRVNIN